MTPPSPDVQLRAATPDDAVALAALATQVFLDTYAVDGVRPDLAREAFATCSPAAFDARLDDPERRVVLAVAAEGGVLGFAEIVVRSSALPALAARESDGVVRPSASETPDVHGAELARLYVQPRAQGRGLGGRLLREAEHLAANAGLGALWLTAWDGNARALAFYAHFGYADAGATAYSFEGRTYGNRVLFRRLGLEAECRR